MDCWTQLDDDWNRGLAVAAASEEQGRVEVAPVMDVRAILHDKQQEFFDCEGRMRAVLGGRQGGKSFGIIAWQFDGALETAESFSPYLALTSKSARNIIWPEVRAVARALSISPDCLHEHTLTVKFPNGSVWQGAGTDDTRTIEAWRGVKTKRPAIDEMGSQPASFLGYFIREIIWPTLIRYRGELALAGTPGKRPTKGDYWYDLTGPARESSVPLFRWTAWDNPHLGTPEDVDVFIEEFLRDNHLTRDSPAFIREWLAQWCEDVGSLVFPVEVGRNTVAELPERSHHGGVLPEASWRYAIGVDVGVVDSTAIAVTASHPLDTREYIVGVEKHEGMLVTQLRDRLRHLQSQYKRAPIVLDTGGMGKYHATELTRQWGMNIEAAEKTQKRSHVRDVRDRLLAGRVALLDGPCCDPLREEWAVLGWDEKRELPEGVDHASDAVLYSLRRLAHYQSQAAAPVDDSPAALAKRFEDEMIAKRLGNAKRNSSRAALFAAQNRR